MCVRSENTATWHRPAGYIDRIVECAGIALRRVRFSARAEPCCFGRGLALLCSALVFVAWPGLQGEAEAARRTGAHWGPTSALDTFKRIGYAFDVTTVNSKDRSSWKVALRRARAHRVKLIIGGHPEPYRYRHGRWRITRAGVHLLRFLDRRSKHVLALFVYNEPYWVNPFTGEKNRCGALSAHKLRKLRTEIRSVWPEAKIYHDLGTPSEWAPGGAFAKSHRCIGQKYASTKGVADYVGAWFYPFRTDGYHKRRGLATLRRESAYIRKRMGAIPVWLNQAHACCGDLRWPDDDELLDWNCATRSRLPAHSLISWYVWRQHIYDDYLANHPEQWALTTGAACR
jgi:hypothetical protein